jgi:hypothetical protein
MKLREMAGSGCAKVAKLGLHAWTEASWVVAVYVGSLSGQSAFKC